MAPTSADPSHQPGNLHAALGQRPPFQGCGSTQVSEGRVAVPGVPKGLPAPAPPRAGGAWAPFFPRQPPTSLTCVRRTCNGLRCPCCPVTSRQLAGYTGPCPGHWQGCRGPPEPCLLGGQERGPPWASPLSPSPGRAILTVLTPQNGAAWHNFPDNGRVLRLCVQNGSQELHVVPEHWCGCRVEF